MIPCMLLLLVWHPAHAQPARTGSNLNSSSTPTQVLMLMPPDEVERIRSLLSENRKDEALMASEDYLQKLARRTLLHETSAFYFGWNANCTVLTSLGRVDEAIAACSTAMDYEPTYWSAVNNRGTAKLVGGFVEQALSDYRAALTLVGEGDSSGRDTILFNIALAEARL